MTARIAIDDNVLYVGVGSALEVDGVRYRVTGIEKPGSAGRVHLEPIGE